MRKSAVVFVLVAVMATVFSTQAQSPASIAGRTMEMSIQAGTDPFADRGDYRFLSSELNNRYTILPTSAATPIKGAPPQLFGGMTYTKTGTTTGTINMDNQFVGNLTLSLTFNNAFSGTWVMTRQSHPGASQSGAFILYSGQALASFANVSITILATSGDDPFGLYGAYRLVFSAAGTYNASSIFGDGLNSTGTYSYQQDSQWTGTLTYNDSVVGDGISMQISFDTGTSGSTFSQKLGTSIHQTGLFSIDDSEIAPTIASQPESQSIYIGNPVSFYVAGQGTAPLTYQWRLNGNPVSGANQSTYTIDNVQPYHGGTYTVHISNSAGSITSNPATLTVIGVATQPPTLLSPTWNASSGFSAILQGQSDAYFRIQWSTNLIIWNDLDDLVTSGASTPVSDPVNSMPQRFYRAVSP